MSLHQQMLEYIQSSPDGVTKQQLMDRFNITSSAVYTHIYHLRSKDKEPIVTKNFKYFYKIRKGFHPPTVIQHHHNGHQNPLTSVANIPDFNHNKIIESFKELDPAELEDALKNVRNSVFYALSAQAVVQAKRFSNKLREQVNL